MIQIIPFSKHHLSDVVDVILPIQQSEFSIPITLNDQPDLLDIPGFYQKGKGNFWVALRGSEIVGTIALLDIDNDQGALRKMFVKEQYRGSIQGIARQLVEHCLTVLAGAGIQKCHLFIFNDNVDGIEFWKSIGWFYRSDISVISKTIEPF